MLNSHVADKLEISQSKLDNIRNIIFDLGGVVINIRYQNTLDEFRKLGVDNFESVYTFFKHSPLFELLETGKIPPQDFRQELRNSYNHLLDSQIDHAWCAMIGVMPPTHISLLKEIRRNYRTFLFSNTNSIHIDYFNRYLEQSFGYNPLPGMFEKVYYSHEVGLRKPNPEAFEAVTKDAGLNPGETLFIDDLKANVEGARKTGLLAYHLENESLSDLFRMKV